MARIRIDCRQAHWLLSQRRDGPLRLSERLALWVHLRYCDVCTTVARQFRLLSEAVRRLDEP
jgi:hypothetical protein